MKAALRRAVEPRPGKTRRRAGRQLPEPRLLVLLFLAALLGGCDYFFASPFPDTVSRMVARADLGSVLPRDPHGYYRLEVRNRPDGAEYVVALSEGATYGIRVAIFDSLLTHLATEVLPPYQDLFDIGAQVLFDDVSGEQRLYAGRLVFDSNAGFARLADAAWSRYYGQGFYDSVEGYVFPWVDYPNTVASTIEPPSGGGGSPGPSRQISAEAVTYGGLRQGVFHDMELGTVALYARSDDGRSVAGVRGPDSNFFASLVSPILDDPDAFSILCARYADDLWYTRRGTVVFSRGYDNDDAEMAVYDFSWPEARLIRTYRPHDRGDIQYAYSVDGRHFYVLSPRLETLVKARTWW